MAVELAAAYVSIVPSAKGITANLRKEMGGPVSAIGSEAGRGFASNMVSGLGDLGSRITSTVGKGVKVGIGAVGAVVAAGLWGGMQRALDREDAIITFRRMGLNDANITQLTDAIDRALQGTPIANPEGFALAGRFLAQGFDSADIPGIVATIADMSSVGNRSFQEMADVMVAAAGAGRLTAAELNRLGDVPLNKVAAELGMTEREMRDMVSAGDLTAEAFLGAFAAVDEFSGAAKDPTTRVAFSNLRTAVSALGEQFLSPLLGEGGVAQQAMLSLREVVSSAGPFVSDLGERFSGWLIPAVQSAAGWFTGTLVPAVRSVVQWFGENREAIGRVVSAVGPAVAAIGALATTVHLVGSALRFLGMSSPVGILMALTAAVVYAWQNSETFRSVVTTVGETLWSLRYVIAGIATAITATYIPAMVRSAAASVAASASKVKAWAAARIAVVSSVAAQIRYMGFAIRYYVTLAAQAVASAGRQAAAWASTQVAAMAAHLRTLPIYAAVVAQWLRMQVAAAASATRIAASWVLGHVTGAATAMASFAVSVAATVAGWVRMGVQSMLQGARMAAAWVLAMGPVGWIIATVVGLVALIVANWDTVVEWTRKAWDWVVGAVTGAWEWIKDTTSAAVTAVVGFFTNLRDRAVSLATNLRDRVADFFGNLRDRVVSTVTTLRDRVTAAFGALRDATIGRITGMRDSVVSTVSNLRDNVVGAVGSLRDGAVSRFTDARDRLVERASALRDSVGGAFGTMRDRAAEAVGALRDRATSAFGALPGPIQSAMSSVSSAVGTAFSTARDMVSNYLGLIKDIVRGDADAVVDRIRGMKDRIVSFFSNAGTWLLNAGKQILKGLTDGIKSMASAPVDAVRGVATRIRNMLPGSPVKEGPLTTLNRGHAGSQIVKMVADGMTSNISALSSAAEQVARAALIDVGTEGVPPIGSMSPVAAQRVRAAEVTSAATEQRDDRELLARIARAVERSYIVDGDSAEAARLALRR